MWRSVFEGWMDASMFGEVSKLYSTEWQWPTFGTRSTWAYAVGLSTYENPNPVDGAIFNGVVVAQETGHVEEFNSTIIRDVTMTLGTQDDELVVDVHLDKMMNEVTGAACDHIHYDALPVIDRKYRHFHEVNDLLEGRFFGEENRERVGRFDRPFHPAQLSRNHRPTAATSASMTMTRNAVMVRRTWSRFVSFGFLSACHEEASGFLWRDGVNGVADRIPEGMDGACRGHLSTQGTRRGFGRIEPK